MESLSELPEDIVEHIVSYLHLDNKTAIQLSLLSKVILSKLQRRPVLVFNHENCSKEKASDSEYQKRYRQELNYMVSTLDRYQEHNIHLHTFSFKAHYIFLPSEHHLLDGLIRSSILKGMKSLSLSLLGCGNTYAVPQSVFEAESLVELSLGFCTLPHPERGRVVWPNLKRLCLNNVYFGDDQVFEDIARGTNSLSLIQCLEIVMCSKGWLGYNFSSAWNAESLERLKISFYIDQTIEWNSLQKSKNLKSLTLIRARIPDNIFPNLPQLEELHIRECEKETLNVSSPSLKKIWLVNNENLKEAHFDVPNIIHFGYDMRTYDAIPKILFRGNSRGWFSHLISKVSTQSGFLKLKRFLAALLKSTSSESLLTIDWKGNEVLFLDDEAPDDLLITFPAARIGHVTINAIKWSSFSLPYARSILISLFRICQPGGVVFWDDVKASRVSDFSDQQLWNVTLRNYFHDDELLELLRDDEEMKKIKLEHWTGCPEILPPPAKRLKRS